MPNYGLISPYSKDYICYIQQTRSANMSQREKPQQCISLIKCLISALIGVLLSQAEPARAALVPEDFDSLYDEANQSFRKGSYEEALGLFNRANSLKNNASPECILRIAQTFSKIGAHKNVLQTGDRLIAVAGNDPYFHSKALDLMGNALMILAKTDPAKPDEAKLKQAEGIFRELLRVNPALNLTRFNLGWTLLSLNRMDEGIAELQAYLKNPEEKDLAEKARKLIDNPRLANKILGPDFSFLTWDGAYVTSAEFRGKLLVLYFWGLWAKSSVDEMPNFGKLADKYRDDGLVLIGVNGYDPENKWRDFLTQHKISMLQARDQKLLQSLKIGVIPTYVLIDRDGAILHRSEESSIFSASNLDKQIKQALKRPIVNTDKSQGAATPDAKPSTLPQSQDSDARGAATAKSEDNRKLALPIPKPIVQVSPVNSGGFNSGAAPNTYYAKILNWASMPDDLFTSAKNLKPCAGNTYSTSPDTPSSRIEIDIWSEQNEKIGAMCGLQMPSYLQSIFVSVPKEISTHKIYLTVKDRLTGSSSQSDMVALPY
jgi:tetratricopeptide (TPR) repeat protein